MPVTILMPLLFQEMNDKFCAGKRLRVDVVPELAMPSPFFWADFPGGALNENPARFAPAGVLESVLFQSHGALPTTTTNTHDDHCGG